MGALTSRNNAGVEEVDVTSNHAYRYPPKIGNYFGTHFIMGGERFDMSQPEAYLFGDNSDLNFLGSKPIPFPYPPPTGNEPTKTLKSLVNIRKDSLRFIRVEEEKQPNTMSPNEDETDPTPVVSTRYNIEFTFDCDVRCAITIYYFASEDISNGQLVYHPKDASMNSETFHYKRGANQVFSQPTHILDPSNYNDEEWQYDPAKDTIPVAIHCVVEDEEHTNHSHITIAVVERSNADSSYVVKALKQKQFVDGLPYLLQEIYGIENKQSDRSKLDPDDDLEDSGAECVICMSDMRDTLILPCRHLCLCSHCAESLRYQASSCPICRSPFRALLQVRAMRKKQSVPVHQNESNEENPVSQEGVPPGYEAVSLIEALNGPCNQFFSGDTGFPLRVPGDLDTYHRDKKRSSKRGMIAVDQSKDSQLNQSMVLKADDKKMLEEEEKSSQDVPKVVMMQQSEKAKSPKKPALDSQMFNAENELNELKASEARSPKSGHMPSPYLGESEPDSDYELKSIHVKPSHISAEDLADDEREDTSEGEPEPDYDTDVHNQSQRSHEDSVGAEMFPHRACSEGSLDLDSEHDNSATGLTYIKSLSQSSSEIGTHRDAYQPLHIGSVSALSLPTQNNSSTEGSSFSSVHSSHGLLTSDQISDDDKLKM